MLDPRFLQAQVYVATIAEERSFQRAAQRLRTSPAVLTKRVAEVENLLHIRIFDRSSRPLSLTPAGSRLIAEVQESLLHAERAYELARYWSRMERGPIRIGYSSYSNIQQMQRLFNVDLSRYEAQQIVHDNDHEPVLQLESALTPVLAERVLRGQLHAALGVAPVSDKDLWCESIGKEPYCVGVPKGHRLDRPGAWLPLRELNGETVLGPPRHVHPESYAELMRCFHAIGLNVTYQEAPSQTHALELTAARKGLALLPRSACRVTRSGVAYREISDSFVMVETIFFTHRDTMRNEATKDLILFLAAELKGR